MPGSVIAALEEHAQNVHNTSFLGACADVKEPPGMCYRSARIDDHHAYVVIGAYATDSIWLLTFEKDGSGGYKLVKVEPVQGPV